MDMTPGGKIVTIDVLLFSVEFKFAWETLSEYCRSEKRLVLPLNLRTFTKWLLLNPINPNNLGNLGHTFHVKYFHNYAFPENELHRI